MMQVILLEQIKKLGNIGDVVKVRPGYGRNFLIPNKKALRATKENVAYFESRKAEIEQENLKKLAAAEKVSKKIEGIVVALIQQAGEDGRLYGSVSAADIAKAVSEKSKEAVDRSHVHLHNPIKYIGVHSIEIGLHAQVAVRVNVNVARSEDEAKDAGARFARGEIVMEGPEGEELRKAAAAKKQSEKQLAKPAKEEKEATEDSEKKAKKSKKSEAASEEAPAEAKAEKKPAAKKAKAKKEE